MTTAARRIIVWAVIVQLVFLPLAPLWAQEAAVAPSGSVPQASAPDSFGAASLLPSVNTGTLNVAGFNLPADSTAAAPSTTINIVNPGNLGSDNQVGNAAPEMATSTPAGAATPLPSYSSLMRQVKDIKAGKIKNDGSVAAAFKAFIEAEEKKLDQLGVDSDKQERYFTLLKQQWRAVGGSPALTTWEKASQKLRGIFGLTETTEEAATPPEDNILIPRQPGSFKFNDEKIIVESLNSAANKPKPAPLSWWRNIFWVDSAVAADDPNLPQLADVQPDNGEVVINSEIMDLAGSLNNNPVKILNYVRNNVSYVPYYGAKKGSLGCLREKVCNDVDASSLLIALLRAGGIPARYKKSLALFPVGQLNNFLGVDETKTAFAALALNKVPVYTINSVNAGKTLADADFSLETQLAVEWVFAEAFYDYDQRGGDIDNQLSFTDATTTAAVQLALGGSPKKQWLALDAVVKPSTRLKKEIVADTAQFDTQSFWNNYLSYQGSLSPLNKYIDDLASATGKNITDPAYQSVKIPASADLPYLPPTLPYYTRTGSVGGSLIQPEAWSVLPASLRQQVTISLRKAADNSVVLQHTFFGNEINNVELNLNYEGATDQDRQIIDSYGGIAYTPAALASLKPYLESEGARYDSTAVLQVGDTLILEFNYLVQGQSVYLDEKFSLAGNQEGIYIVLSKVQDDPALDTNSHILLRGNTGLARKYLLQDEQSGRLLGKSLDYEFHFSFVRAVVTQNRVLAKVNGLPTTFDFQGLTLDSSTYITDYSNRGDYRTHQKDFRLLWGLNSSYYEGQLLEDITGLQSIATVQGLQYAYAHPADYTVYTIASTTPNYQSLVSSLALSDATKNNIIWEIQQGNTVITPDKIITDGIWRGVLYIVRRPDFTAQFAIGEQVSNGGWTTDGYEIILVLIDGKEYARFKNEGVNDNFVFADGIFGADDKKCRMPKTQFLGIMNNQNNEGWQPAYGLPCLTETKQFGSVNHTYILTTEAAKFYSPSKYDYWVTEANAKNILSNDKDKDNTENLSDIKLDSTFKFNPIAGTYSWFGHYGWRGKMITAYYQPTSQGGAGRMVYGDILDKLTQAHFNPQSYLCSSRDTYCGKENYVLNTIGFPTGNKRVAAPFIINWGIDTQGYYQDFIGGQVYVKTSGRNKIYYVPGKISEYYNNQQNCRLVNGQTVCGSGGVFGFPTSDPYLKNDKITLKQTFESEAIVWNTQTGATGPEYAAYYYCDEVDTNSNFIIGKALLHGLWDGGSSLAKGAIIFGATAFAAGATIDFVFGTHGGATIAAWSAIGIGATIGVAEVYRQGVSNVFANVDQRIQYEFEHSNCTARKAYLFSRYVPEAAVIVLGIKDLAVKTPSELRGITLTNNIFTASQSEVLPRMKSAFIQNLGFFDRVFRRGEADRTKIIEDIDLKVQSELATQTKIKGTSLTQEEESSVITKEYTKDLSQNKLVVKKITEEVEPTLDRITRGEKYPWQNDGSIYKNISPADSGRPPIMNDPNYYTEYVHPTYGLQLGDPGLQRVIIGKGGEVYFTADHYHNFIRLK